jgi:hypothetical protein
MLSLQTRKILKVTSRMMISDILMIRKKMAQDILKTNKIQRFRLIINSGKDPSCISRIDFISYLSFKNV